ncbi:hypothetical protein AGLY_002231 [Aphis glycines]|uniref:Uncharacterized protein n=1 Tax=Aphis glycines TaxID=307491 RepID=A0A6G0U2T7_APHGL|nr:hypothetical protein AGLY_002231 [Aphis glycines]
MVTLDFNFKVNLMLVRKVKNKFYEYLKLKFSRHIQMFTKFKINENYKAQFANSNFYDICRNRKNLQVLENFIIVYVNFLGVMNSLTSSSVILLLFVWCSFTIFEIDSINIFFNSPVNIFPEIEEFKSLADILVSAPCKDGKNDECIKAAHGTKQGTFSFPNINGNVEDKQGAA